MPSPRQPSRVASIARLVLAALAVACGRERTPEPPMPADSMLAAAVATRVATPVATAADSVPNAADSSSLAPFDSSGGAVKADSAREAAIDAALARFDAFSARYDGETVDCYVYPRWIVVAHDRPGEVGTDFYVRPSVSSAAASASDPGCAADSLAGDFVVRNEWAEYFMGMRGDWLFLDSGTGPSRGLVVWDVVERRELIGIGGVDVRGWRDSATLVLWKEGDDDVPRELCPEIGEFLGAGADTLYALELPSARMAPLGVWRCSARQ